MNGSYSYIDIGKEDLLAAKEMLNAGLYNHTARFCQQYVEKVFKECISKHCAAEVDLLLLHSHKLARLAAHCGELKEISFSRTEMAFFRELTDYYFDTNYPGENYFKVSKEEARIAYNETLQFQADYEEILCNKKSEQH